MDEQTFAVDCPLLLVFGKSGKRKLLFLTDELPASNREREAILDQFRDFEMKFSCTVSGSLRALSQYDFEEVHLNHNLVDEFDPDDAPGVCARLIKYLKDTGWPPSKRKPIFRIHSDNIFAAYLMVKTLQGMGHWAFYEPMEGDSWRKL